MFFFSILQLETYLFQIVSTQSLSLGSSVESLALSLLLPTCKYINASIYSLPKLFLFRQNSQFPVKQNPFLSCAPACTGALGQIYWPGTTDSNFAVHQHIQVIFSRATFQPVYSQPVLLLLKTLSIKTLFCSCADFGEYSLHSILHGAVLWNFGKIMLITYWCFSSCWVVLSLNRGPFSFSHWPASKKTGSAQEGGSAQPGQLT